MEGNQFLLFIFFFGTIEVQDFADSQFNSWRCEMVI